MKRFQAFKFELMPTGIQRRDMHRFAGACRFVFNKALALQQEHHAQGMPYLSYVKMAALLPNWKRETGFEWLSQAPSQSLQHALKDLDKAYQGFFAKRSGFPKFKKKYRHDSFRYPAADQFTLDQVNGRIKLPKLGWMRYRKSRDVLGTCRHATVSYTGGRWFISMQTEREVDTPMPSTTSATGIDMGITRFATFSDGSFLAPLNSFKKHEQGLKKYQRRMSRKVKFSQNWKKAKAKVSRMHIKIANARRDYLHKASTAISQNHAMVSIEDLQIRNMSRSSKGNTESPGKRVAQKSGLNRSILDQGWGEFRRQLSYKMDWHGGYLVTVPAQYTSQTCPCCGYIAKENRHTQAQFQCVACAYENHADVVGAINILERGHRLLACGANTPSGVAMKQEPTKGIVLREQNDSVGIS